MHISGGQFNPAVSIALALIGKQPWGKAMALIMAQLIGAVLAAAMLRWVFPADAVLRHNLGATLGSLSAAAAGGAAPALFKLVALEVLATFALMIVILGSAVDPRGVGKDAKVGGFAIGLTVAACILAIGPLTGASMNPCRSFGPALVGGHWDVHWVYWVAPIAGASLAALVWKFVMEDRAPR
jgi:aquaporin Z